MKINKVLSRVLLASIFLIFGQCHVTAATIDFGIIPSTTGTINIPKGNPDMPEYISYGPLTGTNIEVGYVTGIDTPFNSGQTIFFSSPAILNMTSGPYYWSEYDWSADVGYWEFEAGGTVTLDLPGYGNLFTGSFVDRFRVIFYWGIVDGVPDPLGTYRITGALFTDTKDPNFLSIFGLPTDGTYNGTMNIVFTGYGIPWNYPLIGTGILAGNVTNSPVDTPIPEPGTMLLLGSGLFGLAGYLRRISRR